LRIHFQNQKAVPGSDGRVAMGILSRGGCESSSIESKELIIEHLIDAESECERTGATDHPRFKNCAAESGI
jgi:hypothetical protein